MEAGEIKPLFAASWPLPEIATARAESAKKDFIGNFVLTPPPYECLWVVPETGADQFGFGDVIKLTDI